MKRKIGIFGGTFDPIHLGHIGAAISLSESHGLDEVIFVPAAKNPQKDRNIVTESHHRLKMIELSIQDIASFTVSTIEIEREAPSYMIDTIALLYQNKKYQNDSFFLLLGDDLLSQFMKWKDPHEILRLAKPLVAKRGELVGEWKNDPEISSAILKGITKTPIFEVSSTEIRRRVKKGLYYGHLVDRAVLEYIEKNSLYLENLDD